MESKMTCSPRLPCGLVGPTLFKIFAIIGLRPTCQRYALGLINDERKLKYLPVNFKFARYKILYPRTSRWNWYKTYSLFDVLAIFLCLLHSVIPSDTKCFQFSSSHPLRSWNLFKFVLASLYKSMDDTIDIYDKVQGKEMERREKRNLNITLDNAQMSKSIFTWIHWVLYIKTCK